MKYRVVLTALILFFWLAFSFGCGYHLSGTGSRMPEYIKSIYIPNFKNNTALSRAEQFVTFAIRGEFLKRSKLRLVEIMSAADASLVGEIAFFDVKPAAFSKNAQANLFNLQIRLNVKFIDLKNSRIIFESKNLSFLQQYEIDTGDFFSQESGAMEKISDEFASSIVSTILENF